MQNKKPASLWKETTTHAANCGLWSHLVTDDGSVYVHLQICMLCRIHELTQKNARLLKVLQEEQEAAKERRSSLLQEKLSRGKGCGNTGACYVWRHCGLQHLLKQPCLESGCPSDKSVFVLFFFSAEMAVKQLKWHSELTCRAARESNDLNKQLKTKMQELERECKQLKKQLPHTLCSGSRVSAVGWEEMAACLVIGNCQLSLFWSKFAWQTHSEVKASSVSA